MAASSDLTYFPRDRPNQCGAGFGASVVENSHGGVSKQDSLVLIDTVAVLNWCFLLRCCTNRVAASFDLTYYPGYRRNLFGVGLGRQWLRIAWRSFETGQCGLDRHCGCSELVFPAKVMHESSGSFFGPYLLSEGSTEPVWCRIGAPVVENSHEENRNRTVWSRLTPWLFRTGVSC